MNAGRLKIINFMISKDRAYLAKLFWEYRQQYLDQCDAMTDLGLPTSDQRWIDCQTNAKECAFTSWFYGNTTLNAG